MAETDRRPYVIGLTGNIATGKSTVLAHLASKGAHIIDADKLAHRTFTPDGAAYEKVIALFGNDLLDDAGTIDRAKLGAIVFAEPDALAQLEAIVHPATFELFRWDLAQTDAEIVILEAIKLLESGRMLTLADEVWVITSHPDVQLKRLVETRGLTEEIAQQRMAVQSPQSAKMAQADHVILNDGTVEELYTQLDKLWENVLSRARLQAST